MTENCPMRHENGNCIPAGGFCTANKNICEALLNAYRMGKEQLSKESATSDLISRQAAIDEIKKMCDECDSSWCGDCRVSDLDGDVFAILRSLPSAQPDENDQEFIKLTVRNSNGRPYYSIIYLEYDKNGVGHDFVGYSSYSLDVISDYLKKYFMPSAQPEQQEGEWVYGEDSTADCVDGYRCSQCGFFVPWDYNHKLIDYINDYAYCPNCGARMKGASE